MYFFDPLYFIVVAPAIVFALYAQWRVSAAFNKYSQVRAASGMTGAQVAEALLRRADPTAALASAANAGRVAQALGAVQVEGVGGRLTDHYDPSHRILRLSESVYGSDSLAALGVAAHEAGHAFQHAEGYRPLGLRSTLVPAVGFGSRIWPLMLIGYFLTRQPVLIDIGIVIFTLVAVFSLITLPVEFNASARAMRLLTANGYVTPAEAPAVRQVLNAAAMTYVAAVATAVLTVVYLLLVRGRR